MHKLTHCAAILLVSQAYADDTSSGYSVLETADAAPSNQRLTAGFGFTSVGDADFDNNALGELSVWRASLPVRYMAKFDEHELILGGYYERSQYDTSQLGGTIDFNTIGVDALWRSMCDDHWGYFVYGAASWSADTDASLSDGFTGIGGLGARYVWSDNLSLGLGVAVISTLEDDAILFPIISLNWQIDERWNLRTLNGATLTYDLNGDRSWLLDASAKYQRREYRLDGQQSLIDEGVSLELGATYQYSPSVSVRGFAGVLMARNLEVRQNDSTVTDEDADPAPIFGLSVNCTF